MSTLYIYNIDTNTVIARIHGDANDAIEAKMAELNYDNNDDIGATYSPAFGAADGLIDSDEADEYEA